MHFKHMVFLIIGAIVAMFYITEQNLDYNDFVKFVNQTQPHKIEEEVEEETRSRAEHYGGVFSTGHCVRVDEIDYYKIIAEEAENYIHVTCKFGGKCLTTPMKTLRTDFEITFSTNDMFSCPLEN